MKLKYLLTSLILYALTGCADNVSSLKEEANKGGVTEKKKAASEKKTSKATEEKSLIVSDTQVDNMRDIMRRVVHGGKVSGPEELFKIINGQTQTTDRELPVPAAVTNAIESGLRIVCYQEGSDAVVASTDSALLGKSASDFRTSDGEIVRDVAIRKLRESGTDEVIFTYVVHPKDDGPLVNGKTVTHGRVVVAEGRRAFPFHSEKKFLCTAAAKIDAR